tara:strand:+ start:74 stop:760 length:687 start_codon:yes stop_codon:yes gene_type:complete
MIPKIIHQIWLGGEVPETFQRAAERLKRLHPDYEYMLWTDDNLPTDLINQSVVDDIRKQGELTSVISDCYRYEILARYGGVYSDFDIIYFKSFDELIHNKSEVIIEENSVTLTNCFIAAEQNHPLLHNIINRLRSNYFGHRDTDSILMSGGIFFYSDSAQQWPDELFIVPREYFVAFCQYWDWVEFAEKMEQGIKNNWYGLHYWGHKDLGSITERMTKTLDYLEKEGL